MEPGAISGLFQPIRYVGTVQAVRLGYEVYSTAGGDFLVFSPSVRGSSSFHMTVVSAERVEAVDKALTKDGVTSGSLMKDRSLSEAFGDGGPALRFDILMALYVLTARGRAEMIKSGRNLVFTRRAKV